MPTILNSYARLSESNPDLFHSLSKVVIATQSSSFEVHHITQIMNAFAKCSIRKPQMFQILTGWLEARVDELSPQHVSNVAHACAKLDCYDHRLFHKLQNRVISEDLSEYKLFELCVLTHSLAKLRCGGQTIYSRLFAASASHECWEPQSVVQLLDAMRRKSAFFHRELALKLMRAFYDGLQSYAVHPLTQGGWCLVELDMLDLAESLPPNVLQIQDDESFGQCALRTVFVQLEKLALEKPFTATQQRYVQQLIRSCQDKYDINYGLLPSRTKAFCKSLFDVPTAVVTSVARGSRRSGRPTRDH